MKRAAVLLAFLVAACPGGGDEPTPDSGISSRRDAGRPDAMVIEWPDASVDTDASTPEDAGTAQVAWCNVQSPATATIKLGGSVAVYGQVLVPGVTSGGGQGAGVVGQLGFGPVGSDPRSSSGWVWSAASFNEDKGDNDEYQGRLSPTVAGKYAYAFRFRVGSSAETYCDTDGGEFSPNATGVLDVRPSGIDWCNLQFPPSATVGSGGKLLAFSLVYLSGTTDQAGQGADIEGELGFGPANSDGSTSQEWTWQSASFNTDDGNNDEYKGEASPAVGSYAYAFRFRHKGGPWTYCDRDGNDGSEGGYSLAQQGTLTVTEAKPPAVDWCNTKFPTSATIAVGGSLPVFGQVFVAGVTEGAGAGSAVKAQLGIGAAGTDGSGDQSWTWTDATFNVDEGNNDEYVATLSPTAEGGYAYAFRFSFQDGNWLYCDVDGNDGTAYSPAQQGSLTVAAAKPPTVDWCRLQIIPGSGTVTEGEVFSAYGQVLVAGVTDGQGAGANVEAQLGLGPEGSDASSGTGWDWQDAEFNVDVGNNDEYLAEVSPAVGSYAYAYRFRYNNGTWLYCDSDGSNGTPGSFLPANQGALTVQPVPQPTIDYCQLQWPPNGTISEGTSLELFGQVYKAGVTEPQGAGAGIDAEIGIGPAGTNGASSSEWTWSDAHFNLDANNNDEYAASLSPAEGTYAYAYRFRQQGGTWLFCDLDGSLNGYSPDQQGTLTVNAAQALSVKLRPLAGAVENVGAWFFVSGEVFKPGTTDAAGQGSGISAEVGIGPAGSQPTGTDWNWRPAQYTGDATGGATQSNDVYGGWVNAPAANASGYDVAMRFTAGADVAYADLDADTPYDPAEAGKLRTFEEPETAGNDVGWCNLQWPATATASADAYGRVYISGVTDHPGSDLRIGAMFGWGPGDTDPRTAQWTWIPATYNVDADNGYGQMTNDEYVAHLTAPQASGTYRYVFRFRLNQGWTYCDTDGANGRATFDPTKAGVLTVP